MSTRWLARKERPIRHAELIPHVDSPRATFAIHTTPGFVMPTLASSLYGQLGPNSACSSPIAFDARTIDLWEAPKRYGKMVWSSLILRVDKASKAIPRKLANRAPFRVHIEVLEDGTDSVEGLPRGSRLPRIKSPVHSSVQYPERPDVHAFSSHFGPMLSDCLIACLDRNGDRRPSISSRTRAMVVRNRRGGLF